MTEIDVRLSKNVDGDTKINVKAELFEEIEDDLIVSRKGMKILLKHIKVWYFTMGKCESNFVIEKTF